MARTITSANSALSLRVAGLFDSAVSIQGYAVDDAFTTDPTKPNVALMGVDGQLSGGYTPQPTLLKIKLMASSESMDFFEAWNGAQASSRDTLYCNGSLLLPGAGKSYAFGKGVLTSYKPTPDGKKNLEAVEHEITFESCVPTNI